MSARTKYPAKIVGARFNSGQSTIEVTVAIPYHGQAVGVGDLAEIILPTYPVTPGAKGFVRVQAGAAPQETDRG